MCFDGKNPSHSINRTCLIIKQMYLVINTTAYFQQKRSEMRGMSLSSVFSNMKKLDGFTPDIPKKISFYRIGQQGSRLALFPQEYQELLGAEIPYGSG